MKQETLNILFYLASRPLKSGEFPIAIRVTVNGQSDQTTISRTVDRKLWNQAKGSCKGKDRNSKEINDYLSELRSSANSIHKELVLMEALITPTEILKKLFNREEKVTVLKFMRTEIERMESLIGIDYEKVTLNRYWNCFRCVTAVIKLHYKKEDITFPELNAEFISRLDYYYKKEKKSPLSNNTIVRYMKCFKKIVTMAFNQGLMKKNPIAGFKYVQEETDPTFLTKEELKKIEKKKFEIERLNVVKDTFVFCAYTGLAFTDAKELSYTDIVTDNNGKMWIRKGRHKIKRNKARCTSNVPLLEPAIKILKKYREHPKCVETGVCLPFYSNANMNSYLKDIATSCRITKNLTTHVARHTFATTIALANKVSLQNVSKMLGHTSTRMTEHYARVMDQTIMEDMENVALRLSV
ncbi:MAG: site-specific integrase [Dysgonomonas mossii]|uniref:site-specific integrase n=1 Tax=Dysgonomonas mossii TaxID=163665 RepID=UPI0039957DAB